MTVNDGDRRDAMRVHRFVLAAVSVLALSSCGGGGSDGGGPTAPTAPTPPTPPTPTTVTFASVAAGGAHTCALTASGAAYCWGRGESGQLGATAPTSCPDIGPCSLVPVAVTGGLSFRQVVAGGAHTCALTSDGRAYCWGSNAAGQLADGSTTSRTQPAPITAADMQFTALDAGANHTCGAQSNGWAWCWGANEQGQLGDGTTTNRPVPSAVFGAAGGPSFQLVVAGGFNIGHTCGLTTTGAAYCWGDNERGQLGTGTSDVAAHPSPALVSGGLTFTTLTAGLGRHTCGLTSSGAAYCWGENTFGALGNGSTIDSPVPTAVSGGLAFSQLKAGGFIGHTCGLTTSGIAYCWGENERGQVGDGSTVDRVAPSQVTGGFVFVAVAAGFRHTCARTSGGTVYCWGSNAAGQLGINSTTSTAAPAKVFGQP